MKEGRWAEENGYTGISKHKGRMEEQEIKSDCPDLKKKKSPSLAQFLDPIQFSDLKSIEWNDVGVPGVPTVIIYYNSLLYYTLQCSPSIMSYIVSLVFPQKD